jgi:hypothetical protein
VDSLYNRLILEYKKPGVLAASNSNQNNQVVIKQIKDYILNVNVAMREKREAQRLAGVGDRTRVPSYVGSRATR